MSQEKVDKYKQEKYNRKNVKKKSNFKKVLAYIVATLLAVAFIVYIGYSVAIATGLYVPETTVKHVELSDEELASFRQQLIDNNDPYVQGVEETTLADKIPLDLSSDDASADADATEVNADNAETEAETEAAEETKAE